MTTGIPTESRPRVSIEYIEIDELGNAKLVGQRIKVKHLVGVMQAHAHTAEQLHEEAYPHLSLAQIHAALAYYYDHQEEIDRQIREEDEAYQHGWIAQQNAPQHQELVARMRARHQAHD